MVGDRLRLDGLRPGDRRAAGGQLRLAQHLPGQSAGRGVRPAAGGPGGARAAGRPARFAWTGHALGLGMLALLCFTLIEGSVLGWVSAPILASIAGTLLLVTLFVRHLRTARRAVLPVELFASSRFSAANAVGFLINAGVYGELYLLGLFLQSARGADPLQAGVEMLPVTGVFVLGNLLFARLTGRWGVRGPLIAGLLLAAVAMLGLTTVSAAMPYAVMAALLVVANLGVGVAVPAMVAALVEAAGPEHANAGAATMNANRQVGTLVGVALTGIVLAATGGQWYSAAAVDFGSRRRPTWWRRCWSGASCAPRRVPDRGAGARLEP
ncbi:MFS transporter [Streptacidiphilus sp. 4-A2]|nr:MFS transporter [Streptacidiphilus sp. 4-A2]